MNEFSKWLYDDAPMWVVFMAVFTGPAIFVAYVALTIAAIANGYWIIPILLWIVAPGYVIAKAYMGRRGER